MKQFACRLERLGWFRWDCALRQGGRTLGTFGFHWGNRGWIELDGRRLQVHGRGLLRRWLLLDDGDVVAEASRPSWFARSVQVPIEGGELELVRQGLFGGRQVLTSGGREVGEFRRESILSRSWQVKLPDWLAPEIVLFLAWLVVAGRRRQAAASS